MGIQQLPGAVISRTQRLIDSFVSPATRQQYYDNIGAFAKEQPFLFSFLALQLLLTFTPLALFLSFTLGTLLLSLTLALLFSLFWIGVALLVLIPTLFIAISLGIAIWVWAVSSFLVARWVYGFLPVSVKGKTEVALPNGKKVVVEKSGEGYGDLNFKKEENGF